MSIAPNAEGTDLSPYLPDEHGLFFIYHFTADGVRTKDAVQARWTWRSYQITDLHARQEIGAETGFAPAGARCLPRRPAMAATSTTRMDWLYGDLPDLGTTISEARGLVHFRFAFNDTMLIGARKQPLQSVDAVRKAVENGSRKFRSPQELIEAVIGQSLDGMSAELGKLGDALDGIEDRVVRDAWHNERQALVDARRQLVVIHRQMATTHQPVPASRSFASRRACRTRSPTWRPGSRIGRTRSIMTASSCRRAQGCCRTS